MVTAVPVLTAGAVASVAAYQAGGGFKPKASDRNLQVNQVVFSDNKDPTGKDQQKNKNTPRQIAHHKKCTHQHCGCRKQNTQLCL